jgi:hypothetical protein
MNYDEMLTHEKILESYDLSKMYYPYPLCDYTADGFKNYREKFCLCLNDPNAYTIFIYSIDNELIYSILDECQNCDGNLYTYELSSNLIIDGKMIKHLNKIVNINLEKLFLKLEQNGYIDEYSKQKKMYQLDLNELLKIKC